MDWESFSLGFFSGYIIFLLILVIYEYFHREN